MKPFQKWLVWTSSLLTALTGLVYFWMEHALQPIDPWAVVNHPWQPLVLKAHILVAPVLVFAVGLIAGEHVWRHFRQRVRAGRRSGLLAMAVFVPMVVSGYLIQAITHTVWLEVVVWTHVAAGVFYAVGLALHHRVFRNGRRRGPARNGDEHAATSRSTSERAGADRDGDPAARNTSPPAPPRHARPSPASVSARARRRARTPADRP